MLSWEMGLERREEVWVSQELHEDRDSGLFALVESFNAWPRAELIKQ